jgi:GT2 family glycosyltransferase
MGAAFCRNLGVSLANFDYILWGEDDAFLSENYLRTLVSKISDNKILCGSIYYDITPWMTEKEKRKIIKKQREVPRETFDTRIFEGYYRKKISQDITVPFGHALILVPKKAYLNIKYFEGYKINGYREESDAQVQMTEKGYKIIYTSDTECYHLPRSAIEQGSGQHKNSLIKQELFKIINTFIFYDRFYRFLKENYKLKASKMVMKLYFVQNVIFNIFKRVINKIVRKLKL